MVAEGKALLASMRTAMEAGNALEAGNVLSKLKLLLTNFASLPPAVVDDKLQRVVEERTLARDVMEMAVFYSTMKSDRPGFARHMAQVKPYLYDLEGRLPPSPNRNAILGLNLLYLLVENRLAEFHSELELLNDAERQDECISFPIRLEQYLMVGSYDHVLTARSHVPHKYYEYFLGSLLDTVRDAIAECMAVGYTSMTVGEAQKMMMMESPAELRAFAATHHQEWQVGPDRIVFKPVGFVEKKRTIPNIRVITEALSYATELERIV